MALCFIVAANLDERKHTVSIEKAYKEHMRMNDRSIPFRWVGITQEYDPDRKLDCDFRYDGISVSFSGEAYDSFMYNVVGEKYRGEPFVLIISEAGTEPTGGIGGSREVLMMLPISSGAEGYIDLIVRAKKLCLKYGTLEEFRTRSNPDDGSGACCLLEIPILALDAALNILSGF